MANRKYPSLSHLNFIKDFPKSYNKLVDWLPLEGVEKEFDREERMKVAENILTYTPRFLYDFFDDMSVYISVEFVVQDQGGEFYWSINNGDYIYANDRIAAEQSAFENAFKHLEERL